MPNLQRFSAEDCSLILEKHNEKFSSTEQRHYLRLKHNNLSEQDVQVVLSMWTNVKDLDLSNNNIKILPECLNQCQIERLTLDGCKYLEEIRGIPLNLRYFSGIGCKSLTSSCTRMLLSQEHAGPLYAMSLPSILKMIPDWFEHQIRGSSISFWFRKQIPSISCIILLLDPKPSLITFELNVNLFVNGNKHCLYGMHLFGDQLPQGYTYLSNLIMSLCMMEIFPYCQELKQEILKNEWIHVEVELMHKISDDDSIENPYLSVGNTQMGIHVFKEKETMEADVIFSNPYRKRKSDDYCEK
ncbi:disease resistance protein RUN1 [Trifolium repens]|nr:disease resistance protein RUN1 [Trifolium repens]